MLVFLAGGPEFDSQNPGENSGCGGHILAIPREAEDEHPWGSLAGEPHLIGEL